MSTPPSKRVMAMPASTASHQQAAHGGSRISAWFWRPMPTRTTPKPSRKLATARAVSGVRGHGHSESALPGETNSTTPTSDNTAPWTRKSIRSPGTMGVDRSSAYSVSRSWRDRSTPLAMGAAT